MTIAATLIVWEAVSFVAADVTDRPAPVVGQHDVVVALKNGSSTTITTITVPTIVPPPATTPTTKATATTRPSTAPGRGITATSIPAPTSTTRPVSPPTTKPPGHPVAPTTTTAPTGATATFSTKGGSVAVACTSFSTIRLVAALPNDGYQVFLVSGGPSFVDVNFIGGGNNYALAMVCFFGQPIQFVKGHTPPGAG